MDLDPRVILRVELVLTRKIIPTGCRILYFVGGALSYVGVLSGVYNNESDGGSREWFGGCNGMSGKSAALSVTCGCMLSGLQPVSRFFMVCRN